MSVLTDHAPPKVERSSNVTIITLIGGKIRDVDNVIAGELEGRTEGLGKRHLLLDFANVLYVSSSELGTLVTLHKRMRASGGRLTLFNLSAQVFEVFEATHLQTLLETCREEAAEPRN